jgi:hypothetical protein
MRYPRTPRERTPNDHQRLVPKSALCDGASYVGRCRSACVARLSVSDRQYPHPRREPRTDNPIPSQTGRVGLPTLPGSGRRPRRRPALVPPRRFVGLETLPGISRAELVLRNGDARQPAFGSEPWLQESSRRCYKLSVNSRNGCSRLALQTLNLHARKTDYRVNWGDSGGTPRRRQPEALPTASRCSEGIQPVQWTVVAPLPILLRGTGAQARIAEFLPARRKRHQASVC